MDEHSINEAISIAGLVFRRQQGLLQEAETIQLDNWLAADPRNQQLYGQLMHQPNLAAALQELDKYQTQHYIDSTIHQLTIQPAPVKKLFTLRRIIAAAVLIFAIGSGFYYFSNQSSKSNAIKGGTGETRGTVGEIVAGTDRAVLTLSDGTQKQLGTADNGLQLQSNALLLTTPNGGQYQAVLPDGSKVWLNAASSIKFPSKFNNKERRVEITGEVYFEIAKDASRPFKIYSEGQEIEVLGTSFNVNLYRDEPTSKTTLVSGSIKVAANNQTAILKPGQQASIPIISITKIKQITVQTTNIGQTLAWKNGLFNFDNLTLEQVMRQIERWYDVEVVYPKNIPSIQFGGEMSRSVSLSGFLRLLEDFEVHYTLEGRRLIITP